MRYVQSNETRSFAKRPALMFYYVIQGHCACVARLGSFRAEQIQLKECVASSQMCPHRPTRVEHEAAQWMPNYQREDGAIIGFPSEHG